MADTPRMISDIRALDLRLLKLVQQVVPAQTPQIAAPLIAPASQSPLTALRPASISLGPRSGAL